jgi:hypothetical protein
MSQSHQESDENPVARQDGRQGQQADLLKEREERLRGLERRLHTIVAEFDLDPETIVQDSLDSVKEVVQEIYRILREAAEVQDGMLANSTSVWESLRTRYQEVFKTTSKLRPIFKQVEEPNQNRGQERAGTEADDINARFVDRRHQWLASITEFQHDFSAIYNEIIRQE